MNLFFFKMRSCRGRILNFTKYLFLSREQTSKGPHGQCFRIKFEIRKFCFFVKTLRTASFWTRSTIFYFFILENAESTFLPLVPIQMAPTAIVLYYIKRVRGLRILQKNNCQMPDIFRQISNRWHAITFQRYGRNQSKTEFDESRPYRLLPATTPTQFPIITYLSIYNGTRGTFLQLFSTNHGAVRISGGLPHMTTLKKCHFKYFVCLCAYLFIPCVCCESQQDIDELL